MAQYRSDSFGSTLADGSDSFRSTLAGGSDSLRSTLAGESDSFGSTLAGGSDSLRSTLAGGSISYRSTLAGESDRFSLTLAYGNGRFISTLADGRDSLRSVLECGSYCLYKNCCDLCERDGLQKEAVGFCVDCQDYLCTECFRHHLKPKPMRHHVLLDQHQMPSREAKKTRAQYVIYIKVSSKDDSKTPHITGCVVLPGDKLVVVDSNTDKIKLIDVTRNIIVSQLEPGYGLWDITQVGSTLVAVTSYFTHTIYVVNVKAKKLKLEHKLKVKGKCWGIASINDKLVVSYCEPVKVEIINMKGKVLKTVVECKWSGLFSDPMYVAVSKDQQIIYISDFYSGTVTSVDLTGQVQATYNNDKLKEPRGLTVDSAGRVYVCGVASHNIMQLSADLTEVQELLQQSDGVVEPWSVGHCEATDRLYIGMMESDTMKVYQLE